MRNISSEIIINATPERVWQILIDFPKYAEWNPFIRSITGSPLIGSRLEVSIQPPGGRITRFRPKVLVADPLREFRWLGAFLIPGLILDGEHSFILQTVGPMVRFLHAENFRGILTFAVPQRTAEGFQAMNKALKQRAEFT